MGKSYKDIAVNDNFTCWYCCEICLLTILQANESDAAKVAFLDGIDPASTDWATVAEAALEAEWWADADSLLEALVKGTVNGNALRLALELDPSVYRVVVKLAIGTGYVGMIVDSRFTSHSKTTPFVPIMRIRSKFSSIPLVSPFLISFDSLLMF